jgi:hypothetical protein
MRQARHAALAALAAAAFATSALADPNDLLVTRDARGWLGTYSTNRFDAGTSNAFFTALGVNGRSCGTCHVHGQGESLTPEHARRVALQNSADPLFNPVDGSDCPPTSPVQAADARQSSLLLRLGLIRVQRAIPASAEYSLAGATNPKRCQIPPGDAAIGGQLFLFRRPLPSANLVFLSSVMWDARETTQPITTIAGPAGLGPLVADLSGQANAATLTHGQAQQPITGTPAVADIVAFEQGVYTAQQTLGLVDLTASNGGPRQLARTIAPGFFIGQNDTFAANFSRRIFSLYAAWEPQAGSVTTGLRAAIGRGEKLFNERTFTIANVAGLNSASGDVLYNPSDPLADTPITGTCGTCHNTPNVGNHSTPLAINIGVTLAVPTDNNGRPIVGILDVRALPVYTLSANRGGATVQVTDPGRALITGRWTDIGKTKGPVLRGLAARPPFFHNGSAPDLLTVVRFYDARFNMGLSEQEMADLATFLAAL